MIDVRPEAMIVRLAAWIDSSFARYSSSVRLVSAASVAPISDIAIVALRSYCRLPYSAAREATMRLTLNGSSEGGG